MLGRGSQLFCGLCNTGRCRHITRSGNLNELTGNDHHCGKGNSKNNEALGNAKIADQIFCKGADVKRRPAISADHQTCDEPAAMGAEPFEGGRGGRSVADSHADAAKNSEADNQTGIAFHHSGDDTPDGQKQPAQCGSKFGADFILDFSSGNHQKGKHDHTERKGCGGLRIVQIYPSSIFGIRH